MFFFLVDDDTTDVWSCSLCLPTDRFDMLKAAAAAAAEGGGNVAFFFNGLDEFTLAEEEEDTLIVGVPGISDDGIGDVDDDSKKNDPVMSDSEVNASAQVNAVLNSFIISAPGVDC